MDDTGILKWKFSWPYPVILVLFGFIVSESIWVLRHTIAIQELEKPILVLELGPWTLFNVVFKILFYFLNRAKRYNKNRMETLKSKLVCQDFLWIYLSIFSPALVPWIKMLTGLSIYRFSFPLIYSNETQGHPGLLVPPASRHLITSFSIYFIFLLILLGIWPSEQSSIYMVPLPSGVDYF